MSHDPVAPMLEVSSVRRVEAAQLRAPHAARDAVVEAGFFRIDEAVAGRGHAPQVQPNRMRRTNSIVRG